ncbi:YicS family protein [Shimwellia blattae]|uniref:Uncharacterized protein YicS n=1 Tax=Shimwellia blattae (strain ATCC 29907 / DSM 4481 / JCM 1650 / NBRC 105725 / CDC 9005-74) TaxID=630626 RepID=I2B9K1_SHIBC|nr:YicS family protein [Shimwellia blattae]AFJ47205.1 hypothetical protein EBL_c21140 [Shimwellia blattae DSM 4481 = NBRC 105725]GAB82266.1 hypothetical protein EB105725_21_00640 [Shimwellia blattae DSM 4481 = NBRC 105725]VDY64694.1 Uncharacterised protein [Shimwellia blattae]VEC22797.1 Uncharacterised protein [Shimwellia blattae]
MQRIALIVLSSLALSGPALASSPWEGMKFMLDKSVLTADIRAHCKTPSTISDETLVQRVLGNPQNKSLVQSAADYRDKNDLTRYNQTLAKIRCPIN